jgi:hypothetical protein
MTSNDHLQQLVELRGALLREVTRLDLAIAKEKTASGEMREYHRLWTHDSLSWKEALHRAKIPVAHGTPALHG